MVESGRVSGKGRICTTIEKLSGRVSEKGTISVSTGNWQNSGEYWEKVEFVPLPRNCLDEYRKNVDLVGVPENGRIWASIRKMQNPYHYRKTMRTSIGKWQNWRANPKMVESGQVLGKGRIRASIEKLSERESEKCRISVSSEKLQNPGEYQEKVESMPLLKNSPDEF